MLFGLSKIVLELNLDKARAATAKQQAPTAPLVPPHWIGSPQDF